MSSTFLFLKEPNYHFRMIVRFFIFYIIFYLLGKQASITTTIQPKTGISNNSSNQGVKPASRNLLASIPKDGKSNTKLTIVAKTLQIALNTKQTITLFK